MKTQVITHNSNRVMSRRFFVNKTMASLFRELQSAADTVFSIYFIHQSNRSLAQLHEYLRWRIASLDLSKYTEPIDLAILEKHMLDYCDVIYRRVFSIRPELLVFRMLNYSEPLLVDKEKRK